MKRKILFTGDFVIPKQNQKDFFSKDIKNIISQHDIVCCNLEGPIIRKNFEKKIKIGLHLSNNEENIKYLIKNKFNLFCLANNHIFDYDIKGIRNTIEFLNNYKVKHIGAAIKDYDMYEPYRKELNGIKVEIINVAENGFGAAVEEEYGYAYMFNNRIEKMIRNSKSEGNFTIVVCHAGAEHWEVPLPEIRKTYKKFIDLGADLVVAHHPHVPQGWESYKGKNIFYSLGNFMFNKGEGYEGKNSFILSITINDSKNYKYEIIPTIIENEVLYIDDSKNSIDSLFYNTDLIENSKKYMDTVNKNTLEYYDKIYKKLYYKVAGIYKGGPKEKVKQIIKKYILREKFQDKVLYHNLNIETHYWIARRASRLIMKQKNII